MIRLSTTLLDEEDEDEESAGDVDTAEGAGLGDRGSGWWAMGVAEPGVMIESLRRWGSLIRDGGLVVAAGGGKTVVPPDEFRESWGRPEAAGLAGVGERVASLLGKGESLRIESADGARPPPPEPVRLMASAAGYPAGSAPGTGEGADEPLMAATLRICALSCDVWRSVRYETIWSRNSTVTSNLAALRAHSVNTTERWKRVLANAYRLTTHPL